MGNSALQASFKQLLCALFVVFSAVAPAADGGAPRFEITDFGVDGSALIDPGEINRLLAPFKGKDRDFSYVQRALDALQSVYREHGFGAVQVLLPEQELEQGVIRLRVIEGYVSLVIVKGGKYHDAENIRRSLPSIVEGEPPLSLRIASTLRVINENPSKRTTVLFKDGTKEGEVNVTLDVTDEKPQKAFVTLDNTGTTQTGKFRIGLGFQDANLFNRDHVLTMQFVTSPGRTSQVKVFGAGYRIPLYELGDTVDFVLGYSNVDAGTVQNLFNVSGSGLVFSAHYNQFLRKLRDDYEQKLIYGFDYRAYRNKVNLLGGPSLVPDVTVHPLNLTYKGTWRRSGDEVGLSIGMSRNVPGGTKGSADDIRLARSQGAASFSVYHYELGWSRTWPADWRSSLILQGQETSDALVPGEQFGAGGPDSVRGFNSRAVSNDRGYRTSLELYTPNLGSTLGSTDMQLRGLMFIDAAGLGRNSALAGETRQQSISSAGLGLRLNYGGNFNFRMDLARVMNGTTDSPRGSQKLHAVISATF